MKNVPNNKLWRPSSDKMVMIKINPDRNIPGVGAAGDVVEVSERVAMNFIGRGLAVLVDKEKQA